MLDARHLMRQPVITIHAAESVSHAVREMQAHAVSCLLVEPQLDGEDYGILTKGDVVNRVVARDREPGRIHVSAVMSRPVHTVAPECPARECAVLMLRHNVRRLPVVTEGGEPIGIVCAPDVFDALLHVHSGASASWSL